MQSLASCQLEQANRLNVTVALSPASATEVNDARSAAAAVARGCQLPACSMILGVSVLPQYCGNNLEATVA